jgi:hypothetical protein
MPNFRAKSLFSNAPPSPIGDTQRCHPARGPPRQGMCGNRLHLGAANGFFFVRRSAASSARPCRITGGCARASALTRHGEAAMIEKLGFAAPRPYQYQTYRARRAYHARPR